MACSSRTLLTRARQALMIFAFYGCQHFGEASLLTTEYLKSAPEQLEPACAICLELSRTGLRLRACLMVKCASLSKQLLDQDDDCQTSKPANQMPSFCLVSSIKANSYAHDGLLSVRGGLKFASANWESRPSHMLLLDQNGSLLTKTASGLVRDAFCAAFAQSLMVLSTQSSLPQVKAANEFISPALTISTLNSSLKQLHVMEMAAEMFLAAFRLPLCVIRFNLMLQNAAARDDWQQLAHFTSKNGPQQSKTAIILGFRSLQALLFIHGQRRTLRHGHHSLELLQRLHFKFLSAHSHAALHSNASSAPFGMLALMLVLLLLWFAAVVSQRHNKSFTAYFVNMLKMIGTSSFKNMHGALIFGSCYASRRVSIFSWSCCYMTFLIFSHKVKVKDPTPLPRLRS